MDRRRRCSETVPITPPPERDPIWRLGLDVVKLVEDYVLAENRAAMLAAVRR